MDALGVPVFGVALIVVGSTFAVGTFVAGRVVVLDADGG